MGLVLRNRLVNITALASEWPVCDIVDEKEGQFVLRNRVAVMVLLLLTKFLDQILSVRTVYKVT